MDQDGYGHGEGDCLEVKLSAIMLQSLRFPVWTPLVKRSKVRDQMMSDPKYPHEGYKKD